MRKKGGDVSLRNYKLKIPNFLKDAPSQSLTELISQLHATECVDKQTKMLKTLLGLMMVDLDSEDSKHIRSLFVHLYFFTDNKYPVRKTISRIINVLGVDLILECFCLLIQDIVQKAKKLSLEDQNEAVMVIYLGTTIDKIGSAALNGTKDCLIPYLSKYLHKLIDALENNREVPPSVYICIANIVKFFHVVVNTENAGKYIATRAQMLIEDCYKIVLHDLIQFEVKCNAAHIFIRAVDNLPEDVKKKFGFKVPCLQILVKDNGIVSDLDSATNDTATLSIYTAILHFVPGEKLAKEKINGVPIISYLFLNIMRVAKRNSGIPYQTLTVMKTIGILTKILHFLPEAHIERLFILGMDFVWANLDHHVDSIRFITKEVFRSFIKMAVSFGNKGDSSFLKIILSFISELIIKRCSNFIAFNLLAEETGSWFVLQYFQNLPGILLMFMEDISIANALCSTYEAVMKQHLNETDYLPFWAANWVENVKPFLVKDSPMIPYYQRLLISSFELNPQVIESILHYQYSTNVNELNVLLGCIRYARKDMPEFSIRRYYEQGSPGNSVILWRGLLEYQTLEINMCHQSDEIRINTLALVVECRKSTEFFIDWELTFLCNFFKYNVTSQDPNTIQQMKALYKKALLRIREGYNIIKRQQARLNAAANLNNSDGPQQPYVIFLDTLIGVELKKGLAPWANMYRRSICLDLLSFAQEILPPELFTRFYRASDIKTLYGVLNDSYEGNINLATTIIKRIAVDHHSKLQEVVHYINMALEKATSVNISASITASYIFSLAMGSRFAIEALKSLIVNKVESNDIVYLAIHLLTERIEKELIVSKENILKGAKTAPFYGLFFCIRRLIDTHMKQDYPHWEEVVIKLVNLCMKVSTVVLPIVNNLNPEGYLPFEDVSEIDDCDETTMAQMVLVFAWRTVKEVSLLLGELSDKTPSEEQLGKEIFDIQLSAKIADYYRFILYETKHRGAYEQASQGFWMLCKRLWTNKNAMLRQWPSNWVDEVLSMLKGIGHEKIFEKLCSTRRSAGLPFMINSILTREPQQEGNKVFDKCVKNLLLICQDTSPNNVKACVHALNILQSIFRHGPLSEKVTPYIEDGMRIAINGFSSSVWGIRNSSTLLFAALMIRIFGVQRKKDSEDMSLKNRMNARVFFMRYPSLFGYMLQKLKDATFGKADSLSVHPILLILARLYSTNLEDEQQLIQYLPFVNMCLSHSRYRTRVLAAQASVPLIPNKSYTDYVIKLLLNLSDVTISNNYCHGIILQMLALFKQIQYHEAEDLDLSSYVENTFWIFMSAGRLISHSNAALYMDMIVKLTEKFIHQSYGKSVFTKMAELLLWKSASERYYEIPVNTGGHQYRRSRFLLLMQVVGILCSGESYLKALFIKEFMYLCIDSPDIETTDFVLDLVHCLSMDHSYYVTSPLYLLDVIDFPEDLRSIILRMAPKTRYYAAKKMHSLLDLKMVDNFVFLVEKSSKAPVQVFCAFQHFVCCLPLLKLGFSESLAYLLRWCADCDDSVVCAVIGCISMLLHHSLDKEIKEMHFCDLLSTVIYYASPQASLHERLAVCQLLVHNYYLFCNPHSPVSVNNKLKMWNAVAILLEDSDLMIRNTMSTLLGKISENIVPLISEKAREELVERIKIAVPRRDMICLLMLWGLRKQYNPEPDDEGDNTATALLDVSNVLFDKGEINNYAEDETLTDVALSCLRDTLWDLPEDLNYDDKSIFIEEHLCIITMELLNALRTVNFLPKETNRLLVNVLKKLLDFIQSHPVNTPNFLFTFENKLVNEVIDITFTNPLKHTAADRLKALFRHIYNLEELDS